MSLIKQKRTSITAKNDYTRFLKSIELITIALTHSRFNVDRNRYFAEESKKLSLGWRCVPTKVAGDYFEAKANLIVLLGPASERSKPNLEIKASFELHFHAAKPIDRALVDRFADSEVRLLLWPYFREYVSSVSARMHIPPVILPMGTRD